MAFSSAENTFNLDWQFTETTIGSVQHSYHVEWKKRACICDDSKTRLDQLAYPVSLAGSHCSGHHNRWNRIAAAISTNVSGKRGTVNVAISSHELFECQFTYFTYHTTFELLVESIPVTNFIPKWFHNSNSPYLIRRSIISRRFISR